MDMDNYNRKRAELGDIRMQDNRCPDCGSWKVRFNGARLVDDSYCCGWICEECGRKGRVFYNIEYSGYEA